MTSATIRGFLHAPKLTAAGDPRSGRFVCHDVQWTGEGEDRFATFTLTAEEIAEAAEGSLLWTDQDVQRGIKPDVDQAAARELSLADGYPNDRTYVFDASNADDMTEKLLRGDKLFLNPLVWNLRPGLFEAYWDDSNAALNIYSGRVYLPDSHHRHQAICKAVRAYRDDASAYPKFSPSRQFKVELYFLSKEDEGNYFFDKNQRPRPTAQSKAYDLTTLDDLSLLAKKVIDKSEALRGNVNRVTDRLTAKNPQVITLSTLREMMKTLVPGEAVDETEIDGLATVAATFYDTCAKVRPELGSLGVVERKRARESSLAGSATLMHGLAALMPDFNDDIGKQGMRRAVEQWTRSLARLGADERYQYENWQGDLLDKANPLWIRLGIVKPGSDGRRLTVINTGAARSVAGRFLKRLLVSSPEEHDLEAVVEDLERA